MVHARRAAGPCARHEIWPRAAARKAGACPRDTAAARVWYRKSAEGGYFRGAYNYASLLAVEGCLAGAARWFEQAVATAPEPTRSNMLRALERDPRFRTLAERLR